ncbi:MAG: shikimate kinase [Candidatus Izemoplasmatales bacterium]|nr:shikimate kinase [Candidatus Izemoplasmatales bacterium]
MYGLIGKSLKHSLSPQIHHLFGNPSYSLFETENLEKLLQDYPWKGFNVTIPYKEAILPYLTRLEGAAKETQSVNTVLKQGDEWVGYNTDVYGFQKLLEHYQIEVSGKQVVILGNGGAAKSVKYVLNQFGAQTTTLARHPLDSSEVELNSLDTMPFCDIIVHTTPVGMYPGNAAECLIDFKKFPKATIAIDLIYNPLRSSFLLEAQAHGLTIINGLYMLVAQAAAAHGLFFHEVVPTEIVEKTYRTIKRQITNIVLVGMPLSGKSKFARILSQSHEKQLVDTDETIEFIARKKISDIFETEGEATFRRMERNLIESLYPSHNMVISTGGGMIEDDLSMRRLRQNGVVVFLDKDVENIASQTIRNRPLIQSSKDVYALYERRLPKYIQYADERVHIVSDTKTHTEEIEAKLHEYFSH